ncbi:hypothetical protein, variant 2 [Aphanomyces astaci]|nr:hypothetical protein, variant 3 [Aphanomyces astaci]XP_009835312.1 hypothetical protein, variant 2 [Aphanomyces astaci]ETV75263.1 hypothetical protein, variant 2 [Aphanomyces astaci]ETV75264.1 hypothetical protein, variant 3 [Aphanomyces astaci]|eukprot:XP_009835310.1 hypothetical protein, variant 3 [Aphanomyces astaci]
MVACVDASCEYVFGRFELEHHPAQSSEDTGSPAAVLDGIDVGDIRRLRDFRAVIKTKTNPLASWMQGTELAKAATGGQSSDDKVFELNENRISWHYGYVSNRFSTDATHVFQVYCFKRCSLENDDLQCLARVASMPFRLVSSRQIRKEAQTSTPAILSLVDLDKIPDDRFSYMQRATNLSTLQTVLAKIGEFERTPHGISVSTLTFQRHPSQNDFAPFQSLLSDDCDVDGAVTAVSVLVSLVDRVMQSEFVVKIQSILTALSSCVANASKLNQAYGGFIEMLESQVHTFVDKSLLGLTGELTLTPLALVEHVVQFLKARLPAPCFVSSEEMENGAAVALTGLTGLALPNGQTLHSMHEEPPYFIALVAQLRLKFQQSLLQRSPLPAAVHQGGKYQHGKWRRVDSQRPEIPMFVLREYAFFVSQRIEILSSDTEIQIYLPDSFIPVWTTFELSRKPTRPSPGHMGISSHVGMNGRTITAYIAWREGSRVSVQSYLWPMRPSLTRIRFTRHIQMDTSRPGSTDRLMIVNEMEQANHDPIVPPVDADIHAQLSYPATYFPMRTYTEYYEKDVTKKRKLVL